MRGGPMRGGPDFCNIASTCQTHQRKHVRLPAAMVSLSKAVSLCWKHSAAVHVQPLCCCLPATTTNHPSVHALDLATRRTGQLLLWCVVDLQARASQLLQLHTELRRTLFVKSTVLNRSILPSSIPLDLLKFLQMWDYEGGLSDTVGNTYLNRGAAECFGCMELIMLWLHAMLSYCLQAVSGVHSCRTWQ
jgi:hypothetical protein